MGKQYIIDTDDLDKLSDEEKEIIKKFIEKYAKEYNSQLEIKNINTETLNEENDFDPMIKDFENALDSLTEYRNRLINGEFKEGRFIQEEHLKEIRKQLDSLNLNMSELNKMIGGNEKLDELMNRASKFEEQFKIDEKEYVDFNEKRENAQEISSRKKRGKIQRTTNDIKRDNFINESYNNNEYNSKEIQQNKSYEKYIENELDTKLENELENEEKMEDIKEENPVSLKPKNPYDFSSYF